MDSELKNNTGGIIYAKLPPPLDSRPGTSSLIKVLSQESMTESQTTPRHMALAFDEPPTELHEAFRGKDNDTARARLVVIILLLLTRVYVYDVHSKGERGEMKC